MDNKTVPSVSVATMRSPPHLHIAPPTSGRESSLTKQQERFVDIFSAGRLTQEQAAIEAGYAPDSAQSSASRLQRNPLVQQRMAKAVMSRLSFGAAKALSVIERLSDSARSDYVKLAAAQDLLDRAGYKPPDRVDHRLDAQLTVTLDLGHRGGGSETGDDGYSHRPHAGKGWPEDDFPIEDVEIPTKLVDGPDE